MYESRGSDSTAVHPMMTAHTARTPTATTPYSLSMPRSSRSTKSTTPVTSPRAAFSVGQAHPPSQSPKYNSGGDRSPSPNYFGLVIEPNNDPHESSGLHKNHWSPSGSSIKSFTAALPNQVSLESNSDFEAFKRQVDRARGASEAPHSSRLQLPTSSRPSRPRPSRWHTHHATQSPGPRDANSFRLALNKTRELLHADNAANREGTTPSPPRAAVDRKRNSDSLLSANLSPLPPMASPSIIETPSQQQYLTPGQERDSRLSLVENKLQPPSPGLYDIARATTLPSKLDQSQQGMITGAQLTDVLSTVPESKYLILDIRSAQNYSQARIKGALNICIPTTLLKRATFNIEKLKQTFQNGPQATKFSEWEQAEWIIVYDSHATDGRDAITAQNMMKKFTTAGFQGKTGILRGGFNQFRDSFPDFVDSQSAVKSPRGAAPALNGAGLAPVIGGVSLPSGMGKHNPFFSNIRQNVDLADGVGQYAVGRPDGLQSPMLPDWLQNATTPADQGKRVSEKFLNIELEEQKRMRSCYAAFDPQHDRSETRIQLCGVEKGVKNRYKDILPFEHTRVRLQNKPDGSCDYVNASHLTTAGSNKKYIATQGPLPATFEDFWSVVWDQDVRVIVMLTATTEGGQLKCHPYWEGRDFGPIKLKALSEKKVSLDMDRHRSDSTSSPTNAVNDPGRRRANTTTTFESPTPFQKAAESTYVIIRKFAISHAENPFAPMREITHLHFPGWPDFGTPAQPSHLLALVELANVMQRAALPVETGAIVESRKVLGETMPTAWYDQPEGENCRPMLVHCSAGCGRTGAFCTVDTVIDMLKRRRQTATETGASSGADAEGDISMTDAVSPRTHQAPTDPSESYFQQSFSSLNSVVKVNSQGEVNLDTAWVKDDSIDLIQRTVKDFREQRLSMVQSLRQFVLCYETILEWSHRTHDKEMASITSHRKRSDSMTLQLPKY